MPTQPVSSEPFGKKWYLCSSDGVTLDGRVISAPSYLPVGWFPVDLPCTVLDGLVRNGVYPDPFFDDNLMRIPGYVHVTPDPRNLVHNFCDLPMPPNSPFRVPWWFVKEITFREEWRGKRVWLALGGVNYKADIWLNGRQIANQGFVQGSFQTYEIEISSRLLEERNVLAVKVFPPETEDLAITFCDWSPMAPDKCMGFWQPVHLTTSGDVSVRHSFVRCELDTTDLGTATLRVSASLDNRSERPVTGTLVLFLEDLRLEQEVRLEGFETRTMVYEASRYPELVLHKPRVWWPYQMGTAELYTAELIFESKGVVLDRERVRFGIRKVESYVNSFGARTFRINGRDVLIRGAGWTPDLLLRQSSEKDTRDILYLKNTNLNAVRLEGNMASDRFWELADEEGVLVLSGWACCCHWERWGIWKEGDMEVARKSLRSQLLRLRNHPSFLAWQYGSDLYPPPNIERAYRYALAELAPDLPALSSANSLVSPVSGETGMKMTGPYAYVPPSYWYDDSLPGVATGFNTEAGPDVSIPPYEGIRKMFPRGNVPVDSEAWKLHTGVGAFYGTVMTNHAIERRYRKPQDVREYCKIAKLLSYECWRAAFEAYGRNFPKGTGFIAWLLNAAWPNLLWHLYDPFWIPTAGFYAVQNACRSLHVQYSYDDRSVVVVNRNGRSLDGLRVKARLMDQDLRVLFEKTEDVSGSGDKRLFRVPRPHGETGVSFVDLGLCDGERALDRNFYWLSGKPDVFADVHPFYHTPLRSHGDMSAIFSLPQATVLSELDVSERGTKLEVTVDLENDSSRLAFQVEVRLIDKRTGEWILPVYWEENYVTLLPGEKRSISGWTERLVPPEAIGLETEGFNVQGSLSPP